MKKIFKFKYEEKEGFLSVVEKSDTYYALVEKNTPKIEEAVKTHKMLISFEVKTPNFEEVDVNVIYDTKLIKEVYDQLEKDKNLYFKVLDDSLCVLEINKP